MGLLSAITKGIFRSINHSVTQSNSKKAQRTAYVNTGKKLRAARRKKRQVNGSQIYKKEYAKQMKSVQRTHDLVDAFISDY